MTTSRRSWRCRVPFVLMTLLIALGGLTAPAIAQYSPSQFIDEDDPIPQSIDSGDTTLGQSSDDDALETGSLEAGGPVDCSLRSSGVNLSGCDLRNANLYHAYLSGANLSRANLSGANLSNADLSDTDLSDANLSGADLSDANLSRANLRYANLGYANLSGADLSDADLRVAFLRYANLSDAYMVGSQWVGAICPDGTMIVERLRWCQ